MLSAFLDQCAAIGGDRVTAANVRDTLGLVGHEWVWRLTDAVASRNGNEALVVLDELVSLGRDVRQVLTELAQHGRSLLLHLAAPDLALDSYTGDREVLARQGKAFGYSRVSAWIATLHEAINEAKWSIDPRITAEMALLAACREAPADMQILTERIERLEQALAAGAAIPAAKAATAIQKPAVVQPKVIPSPKPPASVQLTPDATSSPQAKTVWDAVLRDLVSNGKRMVHACVSQGQLVSLDDKQAVIRFSVPFSKERTEKEDYRAIIEQALLKATGQPVRMQCVLNDEKKQPPAPTSAKAPIGRGTTSDC